MKLENWAIVALPSDPYEAPELWRQSIYGDVYDNPRFDDGTRVTTSRIVGKRNGNVVTKSGSEYELGQVSAQYEEQYPDAFNRLMNSLDEV